MTKILLTGGGTAGHVMGNLAILPGLKEKGYEVIYVGSKKGIEKGLIEKESLKYFPISSGKLRRYFDLENVTDVFKVIKGVFDAVGVIRREKPDLIFSKGGFVTVPVSVAAKIMGVPFIGHESDITPGLANKLASRFAEKILVTFPETVKYFSGKGVLVGSPIRGELYKGVREKGLEFARVRGDKPVLLIMGGSQGSAFLNNLIREDLSELKKRFSIIHLVGKDNRDTSITEDDSYRQFEYVADELKDVMAATDFTISRAGSNAIYEYLALRIPALLIPLGLDSSRGDQILNAESFEKQGFSLLLKEEDADKDSLLQKIDELIEKKDTLKAAMAKTKLSDAVGEILRIIDEILKEKNKED